MQGIKDACPNLSSSDVVKVRTLLLQNNIGAAGLIVFYTCQNVDMIGIIGKVMREQRDASMPPFQGPQLIRPTYRQVLNSFPIHFSWTPARGGDGRYSYWIRAVNLTTGQIVLAEMDLKQTEYTWSGAIGSSGNRIIPDGSYLWLVTARDNSLHEISVEAAPDSVFIFQLKTQFTQ